MSAKNKWLLKFLQPITGRMITERGVTVNKADIFERLSNTIDAFGNLNTAEYNPIFSVRPILKDRFFDIELNNGTDGVAPIVDGEYVLETPTAADEITLRTAFRGRYIPGTVSVPGIGMRIVDSELGAGSIVDWGYFNGEEGFGFRYKKDTQKFYVFLQKKGETEIEIPREDWDDPLDGSGRSELNFNFANGAIYQMPFIHYGYGSVFFSIMEKGEKDVDQFIPVHKITPEEGVSIVNPNQPISVSLKGGAGKVYLGGRSFGIYGKYVPQLRSLGISRIAQSIGTSYTAAIAFRRKSGTANESIPIRLSSLEILSNDRVEYKVLTGVSVAGTTWVPPLDTLASETAIEFNLAPGAITGGFLYYGPGFTPDGAGNNQMVNPQEIPEIDIPIGQIVVLMIKTFSGTQDVSSLVRVKEER